MSYRAGLDGNVNRYVYVVEVEVLAGSVKPGESVDVIFGDTAFGSRGFAAGYHPQGTEPVGIEVRSRSDAKPVILPAEFTSSLELLHDEPVELLAVAPSTLAVGEMAELRGSLLDRFGNPTTSSTGLVHAFVTSGDVELPEQWIECERGLFRVPFKPKSPGVVRIELGSTAGLTAMSNPVEVLENPPSERLYWGDLHSHADLSFDGLGGSPGV